MLLFQFVPPMVWFSYSDSWPSLRCVFSKHHHTRKKKWASEFCTSFLVLSEWQPQSRRLQGLGAPTTFSSTSWPCDILCPVYLLPDSKYIYGCYGWKEQCFRFCESEVKVKVAQLYLTRCGILQARTLEWVAFPFSKGSSQPRDRTQVSCTAGGFSTNYQGSPLGRKHVCICEKCRLLCLHTQH